MLSCDRVFSTPLWGLIKCFSKLFTFVCRNNFLKSFKTDFDVKEKILRKRGVDLDEETPMLVYS